MPKHTTLSHKKPPKQHDKHRKANKGTRYFNNTIPFSVIANLVVAVLYGYQKISQYISMHNESTNNAALSNSTNYSNHYNQSNHISNIDIASITISSMILLQKLIFVIYSIFIISDMTKKINNKYLKSSIFDAIWKIFTPRDNGLKEEAKDIQDNFAKYALYHKYLSTKNNDRGKSDQEVFSIAKSNILFQLNNALTMLNKEKKSFDEMRFYKRLWSKKSIDLNRKEILRLNNNLESIKSKTFSSDDEIRKFATNYQQELQDICEESKQKNILYINIGQFCVLSFQLLDVLFIGYGIIGKILIKDSHLYYNIYASIYTFVTNFSILGNFYIHRKTEYEILNHNFEQILNKDEIDIKQIVNNRRKELQVNYLHFIPFILFNISTISGITTNTAEEQIFFRVAMLMVSSYLLKQPEKNLKIELGKVEEKKSGKVILMNLLNYATEPEMPYAIAAIQEKYKLNELIGLIANVTGLAFQSVNLLFNLKTQKEFIKYFIETLRVNMEFNNAEETNKMLSNDAIA